MIVDKNKNISVMSSGIESSEGMSIDENSLQHIMGILTNLYSDPNMAVIREYSTNAYDSHVEAGKENTPIEVHLPNVFEPVFKIKDFGVGLSKEEVYFLYGKYGSSTKRNSNAFVGQLGLGSKSALTLTNQFNLVATKNGTKNIFNIYLDEYGLPNISLVKSFLVDEVNGVEVIIPIEDVDDFLSKAKFFYRFFPGEISFVGLEDKTFCELNVFLDVNEKIKVIEGNDHVVVMGGVPYRANEFFKDKFRFSRFRFLIYADIGEVNFTPSREELHYTQKTIDFLLGKEKEIMENLLPSLRKKISLSENYFSAQENQFYLKDSLFSDLIDDNKEKLFFDGVSLPYFFKTKIGFYFLDKQKNFVRLPIFSTNHFAFQNHLNRFVVLFGKAKDFNSDYKQKFKLWIEENPGFDSVIYFSKQDDVFTRFPELKVIFSGQKILDYEKDFSKYKLKNKNKNRYATKKVHFYQDKLVFQEKQITEKENVLMVSKEEAYKVFGFCSPLKRKIISEYDVYAVTKKHWGKVQGLYSVKTLGEVLDSIFWGVKERISKDILKNPSFVESLNELRVDVMKQMDVPNDVDWVSFLSFFRESDSEFLNLLFSVLDTPEFFHHEVKTYVDELMKENEKDFLSLQNKLVGKYPMLKKTPEIKDYENYVRRNHGL